MAQSREIVITGLGVVSPMAIGVDAYRAWLADPVSAVRPLTFIDTTHVPQPYGAEVVDFDPKVYVRPRKSLKVMSRNIQTGYAAADMAMQDAKLAKGDLPPERLGVVMGSDMIYSEIEELQDAFRECIVDGKYNHDLWGEVANAKVYPLWMLKYLPNFPACHAGIFHDARGPNNTVTLGEASSLLAISEAVGVIQRGMADVMMTGGTGNLVNVAAAAFFANGHLSRFDGDPTKASRPFDANRTGTVNGEGDAVLTIEAREFAEARGARIYARILAAGSSHEKRTVQIPGNGDGYRRVIRMVLDRAGVSASDIGHVNAHGEATLTGDAAEAAAIADTLGSDVPVFATKSYHGNLGSGTGAVELLASVLALESGQLPPTLNYETPDPACDINVVHGSHQPVEKPLALSLNQSRTGQTAALLIERE